MLHGDVDHHSLIGNDDNLIAFLRFEQMLAEIPPEGLRPVNPSDQQRTATAGAPAATSAQPSLSKQEIENIQAECFADDVAFDAVQMTSWSEEMVREFFENGGRLGSGNPESCHARAVPYDAA